MIAGVSEQTRVTVIGLGYVGLPLAIALARHFRCIGFDISSRRIEELRAGHDRTGEVMAANLRASTLRLTDQKADCEDSDVYIVTVPTPVDDANEPDLGPVLSASRTVGSLLRPGRGSIIVYESTVYPGVTENLCAPALEEASGLRCGVDFFLGYSPERINPGDREHTVDRITKVISGQNDEVVERLTALYGRITSGGVYPAASIMAAEAAKVIENAQRDINIAFMNEIAMIFQKLGLSAYDVLDAASTKWNFLRFTPGLVGGHCIGVDPYYLAHRAVALGHDPKVILAGRRTNDGMGQFIAECVDARIARQSRILMLGLTFKENVPDLRNSKVIDVVRGLESRGHEVTIHDPLADPAEAKHEYGVDIEARLPSIDNGAAPFQAIVGAVPHADYADLKPGEIARLIGGNGLVADIKGMWRHLRFPAPVSRWQL